MKLAALTRFCKDKFLGWSESPSGNFVLFAELPQKITIDAAHPPPKAIVLIVYDSEDRQSLAEWDGVSWYYHDTEIGLPVAYRELLV